MSAKVMKATWKASAIGTATARLLHQVQPPSTHSRAARNRKHAGENPI